MKTPRVITRTNFRRLAATNPAVTLVCCHNEFEPRDAYEAIHEDQFLGKGIAGIFQHFNIFQAGNKYGVVLFGRFTIIPRENVYFV